MEDIKIIKISRRREEMRYKSIYLENYIGIYAGMHLYRLFIDFDLCKYGNIVLKGGNGAGKTSLFNAISLLPDSSESFIPEKSAIKIVRVYHEDCLYDIKYTHEYKNGGYITKGYFYKGFLDDEPTLCNPNGNITTCKELIFSEFNLDANFESLCELSSTNRGIISKIPSMRKQNFNNIITGVEVYNQIYKVLSKRSTVFKSMINSLVSKIKSTGDEQLLKSSLVSLEQRLSNLEASKEEYIASIAKYENLITSLDPAGNVRTEYDNAMMAYSLAEKSYRASTKELSSFMEDERIAKYTLEELRMALSNRKDTVERYRLEKSRLFDVANDASKKLQEKKNKLAALGTPENVEALRNIRQEAQDTVTEHQNFIDENNIQDLGYSSDKLMMVHNMIDNIKAHIDAIREEFDNDIIEKTCPFISVNQDGVLAMHYMSTAATDREKAIAEDKKRLQEIEQEMYKCKALAEIESKLQDRPKGCTDDTCPFIRDAIEARDSNPEERYKKLAKQHADTELAIAQTAQIALIHNKINECGSRIINLFNRIIATSGIPLDIPGAEMFRDPKIFMNNIKYRYSFDTSGMYKYISQAASLDSYKQAKATLERIDNKLQMYDTKESIISSLKEDIADLSSTVKESSDKMMDYNTQIEKFENEIKVLENGISNRKRIELVKDKYAAYKADMNNASVAIDKYKETMQTIKDARNNIALLTNSLNDTRLNIKTLQRDASQMEYGLSKLAEYKTELEEFEAKFEKVEFLKKCSSPSKKGIQMIFVELYLRDIIRTANKMLSCVMGGEYSLLKPFIDDRSFNFPCMGKGIYHDDIASLSGGESAMVATILSGSIMYHSSTKYNILKFDEMDAQLDTSNRGQFLPTIDSIKNILKCEQTFIITHNEEIDLRNTDLIVLEGADEEVYTCGGNIIFDIHKTISAL